MKQRTKIKLNPSHLGVGLYMYPASVQTLCLQSRGSITDRNFKDLWHHGRTCMVAECVGADGMRCHHASTSWGTPRIAGSPRTRNYVRCQNYLPESSLPSPNFADWTRILVADAVAEANYLKYPCRVCTLAWETRFGTKYLDTLFARICGTMMSFLGRRQSTRPSATPLAELWERRMPS